MKLQHLTVIFVVIIVPISFILSMYIQTQVDTILLQSTYNTKLMDATYDAIKAFQLNTVNNRYSSVSNSKIRDLEAGVSTFYNSLGTSLKMSSDSLKQFTPAVVNTLYDGYYIYSKYSNTKNNNENEYGLQPYIYYSNRYVNSNVDCIINYTLDNAITVYGTVNKGTTKEYVTKTGFLINPTSIDLASRQKIDNAVKAGKDPKSIGLNSIQYDGLTISKEDLRETIIILETDSNGNVIPKKGTYQYTFYNNKKVYYDPSATSGKEYFWYNNYKKSIVYDAATRAYAIQTIGQNRSAIDYYTEAYVFSKWVQDNLGSITAQNAVDKDGVVLYFETNNTEDIPIFIFNENTNNPTKSESTFDTHRRAIIRHTIETSLIAAMANFNYNAASGYEYVLPKLSDEDWDKIVTEVCITTFLQGLPIGGKYYNSYCVIANNQNKEFISKSSIYILTYENGKYTYHKPNCQHLIDNAQNIEIKGAYTKLQLARQSVKISDSNIVYFLPQQGTDTIPYLNCYECIVNVAKVYDYNEFIDGEINILDQYGDDTNSNVAEDKLKKVRTAYFTALAREKYNLYQSISLISGS